MVQVDFKDNFEKKKNPDNFDCSIAISGIFFGIDPSLCVINTAALIHFTRGTDGLVETRPC